MSLQDLLPPGVRNLRPYQPGKPIAELARELGLEEDRIVKLASNENPLGCSLQVEQAIRTHAGTVARYPDGSGYELRQSLSAFYKVAPEQLTLGNGSNDLLEMIAHTFLTPAHHIVVSEYAFAIYALVAEAMGVPVTEVPARQYAHDLTAMAAAITPNTRLVFIANPNNPTGTYCTQAQLRQFMRSLSEQVLVVLDEAYLEYAEEGGVDAAQWVQDFPQLIVCRTFSKAYGLAGLRIGYAISSSEVAGYLNRVRQPFNVGTLALCAAQAALADQEFVHLGKRCNALGKVQLIQGLAKMPVDLLPAAANFLCIGLRRPGHAVFTDLLRQGVIVRPLDGYRMPQHLRISIGTESENERFLQALHQVLM